MRSSFFGIETMRRALLTHRRALDVIGHNVANAATPGYTRQQVILKSTRPYSYPGQNSSFYPGQIGTGVMVEEVRRIRDVFVDNQIRIGNSQKGDVEIQRETLRRIENAFLEPATNEGFNDAMTKFFEAWQELSKRPENMAVRHHVKNMAQNLVDVFHSIDQQLRNIREDLDSQTQKAVDEINRITGQITDLNQEISKVFTHGDTPNDLMDKRDLLLDELSQYVDISVEETPTRGVAVYIGGRVLIRDQYRHAMTDEMTWDHPSQNSEPGFFRDVSENDFYMLSNFARGELKGLAVSRDEIVTEVQSRFTEMVQSLMNEINNEHVKGFGIKEADMGVIANTTTTILPAAPINRVGISIPNITDITVGDILRIEEPGTDNANANDNGEAITVEVTSIDTATNEIYFEVITSLQKADETAGPAYSALANYTIEAGANIRKIESMHYNFFDLQTALQPQYAGDTTPEFSSRMTSSIYLPTDVNLNTTIAELETMYGVDITDNIIGAAIQLDDNATTQNITDQATLQQAFRFMTLERLMDNDGKPLDITFDEVNRRIILKGETREALDQLGGETGSANPLLRILGFEGHAITGMGLPIGTNLSSTLQELGISTGWFKIDNVNLYIDNVNQTLGTLITTINDALNNVGGTSAGTQMFFDTFDNRLKIVSSHQFSTRTNVVDMANNKVAPFTPPVGNSNFLTAMGLQREADVTQDSTAQNTVSVSSSDAGIRIKVSDDIMGDVSKIASARFYAGNPGDNATALAIAQLKNINVLTDTGSGYAGNPTETTDEFYNNMVSKLGTDSQKAITDSEVVDRFLEYYETRRQEISGVSIDEEMTKMIESQRSFQAAARMLNVVDEMLDRIINGLGLVGR